MQGPDDTKGKTLSGSLRDADNDEPRRLTTDQLVGSIFAEKYRILAILGEGGMSMVYKAENLGLKKVVAIKVLHTHLSGRSNAQARFRQEAQSASSLSHPGIIGMHDYGVTEDGTPFLVMDFIEGESLAELLERKGWLPPERALQIFGETCAAIADAHEHGVVHRDLKPSNIMMSRDHSGETHAKVVDFGVAKVLGEPSQSNPGKLTQTGDFVGSPFYMSPEQCAGKPLDQRSDIYSMGCVMYETVTGQVAFGSDSIFGTMFKHLNEMPPTIASIRPELAKYTSLEKVILRALAKDPNKRYQTMRELLADISSLRLGERSGFVKRVSEFFELLFLKGQAARLGIICGALLLLIVTIVALLLSPRLVLAAVGACPPQSVAMPAARWSSYPPIQTVDASDPAADLTTDQLAKIGIDLNNSNKESPKQFGIGCQLAGMLFLTKGRYDEAIKYWQKSLEAFQKCAQAVVCPDESDRETRVRASYSSLAECYYRVKDYGKAAQCYESRRQIDMKLSSERAWLYKREQYARSTLSEADCFYRLHDWRKARKLLTDKELVDEVKAMPAEKSFASMADAQKQLTLAIYHSELADMARRAKQFDEAESDYAAALKGWSPGSSDWIAATLGLASTYQDNGQDDQALATYNSVWPVLKDKEPREIGQNETIVTGLEQYANLLLKHSNLLRQRDDFFKALDVYNKARQVKVAV